MSQTSIIVNTPNTPGHSDAQDWASIFNAIIGSTSGVLKAYRSELSIEKISDNIFRLSDGIYSLQGHVLKVDEGTHLDLNIESGTLGMYRKDYIVAEYRRNDEGDDTLEFKVLKGSSSSLENPNGPLLETGDLNTGAMVRQEVLYTVSISGTVTIAQDNRLYIENIQKIYHSLKDEMLKTQNIPSDGSFNPVQYPKLYSGQLPAGDVDTAEYWNRIPAGIYISNPNQLNSKGSWSLVEILKGQAIPSTNQAITRILWYTPAALLYVGTYADIGNTPVVWNQISTKIIDVSADFTIKTDYVNSLTAYRSGNIITLTVKLKSLPQGWMPTTVNTTKHRPISDVVGAISVDASTDASKYYSRVFSTSGSLAGFSSAATTNITTVSFTYITRD